jgi:hypothetical protein
MDGMGFKEIVVEGAYERIWSFVVVGTSYEIRVFSSVSCHSNVTRANGKDAIRCVLFNSRTNKAVLSHTVYRTQSALPNTQKNCRLIWKYLKKNKCSQDGCDGVMVERVSKTHHKFMGCTNFPTCTHTVNIKDPQLSLKM